MLNVPLLQKLAVALAIVTTFGVLVHDTKFDQATSLALTLPIAGVGIGIGAAHMPHIHESMDHTHIERVSFAHMAHGIPKVQPRDDHRRYLLPKYVKGAGTPNDHTLMLVPALA